MRRLDFEKLTLLKVFNYVDPQEGCVVRQEVRRDPFTGITLTCKVKLTEDTNIHGAYAHG